MTFIITLLLSLALTQLILSLILAPKVVSLAVGVTLIWQMLIVFIWFSIFSILIAWFFPPIGLNDDKDQPTIKQSIR